MTGVEFHFLRGSQLGTRLRLTQPVIRAGRHAECELRFDPERDRDASGRHAEIRRVEGRYLLSDVGSTNGTLVNGIPVTGVHELHEGDVIEFGPQGPAVGFFLVEPSTEGGLRPTRSGQPALSDDQDRVAPAPPRRNTEARIAEAVRHQTGALRRTTILVMGLVALGGGVAVSWTVRATRSSQAAVSALMGVNDSLTRLLEARLASTGVADAALREARDDVARLSGDVQTAQRAGADVSALGEQLRATQARTASFARTDYGAILAANKAAVVFIAVELSDGQATSGTGFNLLPDGLIVTNRHVVRPPTGQEARRIAVAFEGTRGEWRLATIEYVSTTDELALLRLARPGPYPTVQGVARDTDRVRLGDPVAILGFPLGTGTAGNEGSIDSLRPAATLGIGTVSKTLPTNIQLDAYAAQGSSGSPVFDARGLVIGVLYGAARESGGRIIYSVPAARLASQLPAEARRVLR